MVRKERVLDASCVSPVGSRAARSKSLHPCRFCRTLVRVLIYSIHKIKEPTQGGLFNLVRKERLELSRVTPLEPKSSASTSFATFAICSLPVYSAHPAPHRSRCSGQRRVCSAVQIRSGRICRHFRRFVVYQFIRRILRLTARVARASVAYAPLFKFVPDEFVATFADL